MATTNIELDIENVTGVSDADNQFVISAQKFVVSSIPKNLLHWAVSETVPATHGGDNDPQQVTLPVGTDSVISVRRDSYVAEEVPFQDRGFIDNSSSLKKATNIFPKYYIADGNRVITKPDPDSTYKAYVMYVDYSKVDDDSDLRNAVIFHACAKEFTQMATSAIPTWSDVAVPIAPTTPDFGSDLSISSTVPVAPSSPSFDTGAISVSSSAPAYSKPTFSAPSLGSVGSLVLPVPPSVPSISTVSYSDATNSDVRGTTTISPIIVGSVNKPDISGDVPTYTKPSTTINAVLPSVPTITTVSFTDPGLSITAVEPAGFTLRTYNYSDASLTSVASLVPPIFSAPTLGSFTSFEDWWESEEDANPFGDNDPGAFSISAVPPTPPSDPAIRYTGSFLSDAVSAAQDSIAAAQDAITHGPTDAAGTSDTDAPSDASGDAGSAYTKPTVQGSNDELTDVAAGTFGSPAVSLDTWWDTLSDIIEVEEDSELAITQIQKIQAYVGAFQAEVQSASAAMQATIEDARNATQASIANASNDVSTNNTSMQTLVQASIANAGNDVQASISKMQNSTQAATTKMIQSTGAAIQKMQLSTNVNIENAAKTMDALVQDYRLGMQKYEANLGKYQQEVAKEVQEYGQKLARYQLEVGTSYTAWVESTNYDIKKYQADLAVKQTEYQSKEAEFQGELQKKLSDAQDANKIAMQNSVQEAKDALEQNNALVAKYNAESQTYSANIQKGIQSYTAELQSATQTMQATINDNENKMAKYRNEVQAHDSQVQREIATIQADLQNELNEFNKENARYQANVQAEMAKHNSDLQKTLNQAQIDAQDAQQEAALATDVAKFNKAQDQVLALENAAKQIEDVIADNNSKIQKYSAELQSYQMQVASAVQKWTEEEWNQNFLKYQNDYASLLQTYQADIQNELNEFNREQTVFQNELQEKIQEATNQQNKDAQEYSAKLQKYANELQSHQADVNTEIQDYTNTLSKEVQEYQNKVGLYTADLQKYQAEVASETQKTGLNSQKAQVYAVEADKYYQWAVAEVQSYVQNNSKMIGIQMAAGAAQQQ